jgi:hypothetical protein
MAKNIKEQQNQACFGTSIESVIGAISHIYLSLLSGDRLKELDVQSKNRGLFILIITIHSTFHAIQTNPGAKNDAPATYVVWYKNTHRERKGMYQTHVRCSCH